MSYKSILPFEKLISLLYVHAQNPIVPLNIVQIGNCREYKSAKSETTRDNGHLIVTLFQVGGRILKQSVNYWHYNLYGVDET